MAQIEKQPSVSTSQTGGRFEIIQSSKARKLTFRLDKYTGDVYQLVETNEKELVWEKIPNLMLEYLRPEKIEQKISYQLFMGGIAVADCFLMNIHNGITYVLYEDTETRTNFFKFMSNSLVEEKQ